MSRVPQTTDQKIDAALEPNIVTEDWDEFADGTWQQNHYIRLTPESGVDVLRADTRDRDGNVTLGDWTVFIDDTSGALKSTAIARLIAADLEYAAQLADRLNAEQAREEADEFHRNAETLIEEMDRVGAKTIGEIFEIRRRQQEEEAGR